MGCGQAVRGCQKGRPSPALLRPPALDPYRDTDGPGPCPLPDDGGGQAPASSENRASDSVRVTRLRQAYRAAVSRCTVPVTTWDISAGRPRFTTICSRGWTPAGGESIPGRLSDAFCRVASGDAAPCAANPALAGRSQAPEGQHRRKEDNQADSGLDRRPIMVDNGDNPAGPPAKGIPHARGGEPPSRSRSGPTLTYSPRAWG